MDFPGAMGVLVAEAILAEIAATIDDRAQDGHTAGR